MANDRIHDELLDSLDEELEMELDDDRLKKLVEDLGGAGSDAGVERKRYYQELFRLQGELVKLQDWVVDQKLKVVVLFEGRDAAGGEIVLFDRSWYNRAGVERVMNFCSEDDVEEFFRTVPEFERMVVRSGIVLIKYWFSITDQEQYLRFQMRLRDPLKQWKLSPMDLESRRLWEQYTKAKEAMLERTHIPEAPWWIVDAVDKKRARLNCIHHLLAQIPYREVLRDPVELPARVHHANYIRGPIPKQMYVPAVY